MPPADSWTATLRFRPPGVVRKVNRGRRLVLLAGWALVAAAVTFTIRQAISIHQPRDHGSDFGFIWIAGRMWAAGADPYGPQFAIEGTRAFAKVSGWSFVYPPQWWLIARPLAALTFEQTSLLWRIANIAFIGLTGFVLWRASARWRPPVGVGLRIAFLVGLFSTENIGATFYLDQTSLFMLLGFALLLAGAEPDRPWAGAAGLFILMMKPSVGLPIIVIALTTVPTRRALLFALVASAIACLPLLVGGVADMLTSAVRFLHNIGGYNAPNSWNAPEKMNGLINLVPAVPSLLAVVLAAVVGVVLAVRLLAQDPHGPAAPALLLAVAASAGGIAPLHTYDLAFTACSILLLGRLRPAAAVAVLIGVLLIHSAKRICGTFAEGEALVIAQSRLDSVGGLCLLLGAVLTAIFGWAHRVVPTNLGDSSSRRSLQTDGGPVRT